MCALRTFCREYGGTGLIFTPSENGHKERKPVATKIAQSREQYNQLLCCLCHQFIPTCVGVKMKIVTYVQQYRRYI